MANPRLIRPDDVAPTEHTPGGEVRVLDGADHEMGGISLMLSTTPAGGGPRPHRHPYVEVFVVHEGTATYVVGDEEVSATAGDVVVVPAGAWHSFRNTGETPLRQVAVHDAPRSVVDRGE